MNSEVNQAIPSAQPEAPKKRNRKLALFVIGGAVLLLVIVAAVVLLLDPFKLGLLGRLSGTYDPIAEVVPADTSMYVGFNLLNSKPNKIGPVFTAFTKDLENAPDMSSQESMYKWLDEQLPEALGPGFQDFTFTGDIVPWLGQYIGIGISDIKLDEDNNPVPGIIVAIESRSAKAADAFLEKLQGALKDGQRMVMNTSEYLGVTIYAEEDKQLAFARSDRLVLFGMKEDDIKTAIDTQKGESLADNKNFKAMTNKLSKDRLLSFYIATQDIVDLIPQDQLGVNSSFFSMLKDQFATVEGIGISLRMVDAGVQMDFVTTYNVDKLSDLQKQTMESKKGDFKLDSMLPDDTILYFAGSDLDLYWRMQKESLSSIYLADFDQAMTAFKDQLGFSVDDLLSTLSGEYGLAVFPTKGSSPMSDSIGLDIGAMVLAQTNNAGTLSGYIKKVNKTLEENGLLIKDESTGDLTIFSAGTEYSEENVFAYGVGKDWLAITLPAGLIQDIFDQASPLKNNQEYQSIWKAFPGSMTPVLYLNFQELLGLIKGQDPNFVEQGGQYLEPITHIALASSGLSADTQKATIILFVNQEK